MPNRSQVCVERTAASLSTGLDSQSAARRAPTPPGGRRLVIGHTDRLQLRQVSRQCCHRTEGRLAASKAVRQALRPLRSGPCETGRPRASDQRRVREPLRVFDKGAMEQPCRPPSERDRAFARSVGRQERAGTIRPRTSPSINRPPPLSGAVALMTTSSPSSRKVRVLPSSSCSGVAPFDVISRRHPR